MNHPDHSTREAESVRRMFARVAGGYDRINRAMCFGMDVRWRRILAKHAVAEGVASSKFLDLACGSGDIACEILKANPDARLCACDLCPEMLEHAQKKIETSGFKAEIVCANAESLPFEDSSFGACTIGFGFRNFEDRKKCLKEINRILLPQGGLFILEVARARPVLAPIQNFFMERVAPNIACMLGGNKADYKYLAKTTRDFPRKKELEKLLADCGFHNISTKAFAFGFVAITKAFKQ